jgi:alkanesulfonate monooxygenase SsuD/methylene tetrahydromethanopterin reductase-like flavin-dependent oxidoreductase (luciferase family)
MPSFPTDGSRGLVFLDQIINTLERIQGKFVSAWADDHVHPWASFQSSDTDALECLTTIAYLAGLFPEMDFGSLVLCQSYRNPALLAKTVANLQLLCRGRFIFGLGAGWLEEEYLAYGYEFPKPAVRLAQLDETLQIVRKLWTETPASFEGKYYHIKAAYCEPKPDPIPPIMIGGGGEKLTLRLVAKYADWWNMPGQSAQVYAHKLNALRDHCRAAGRNYAEIVKTWSAELVAIAETEAEARRLAEASPYNRPDAIIGAPDQVAEQLRAYANLGVEHFFVRFADFPDTAGIELFADTVIPQF